MSERMAMMHRIAGELRAFSVENGLADDDVVYVGPTYIDWRGKWGAERTYLIYEKFSYVPTGVHPTATLDENTTRIWFMPVAEVAQNAAEWGDDE